MVNKVPKELRDGIRQDTIIFWPNGNKKFEVKYFDVFTDTVPVKDSSYWLVIEYPSLNSIYYYKNGSMKSEIIYNLGEVDSSSTWYSKKGKFKKLF